MNNNKNPGLDGFTVEFFKFFWVDIGQFTLRSLNFGYLTGSLSITQKQGIITCIPKPNKPRINLKNWRLISNRLNKYLVQSYMKIRKGL